MDTIKSIIQWFILNVLYCYETVGFVAVLIIGFFAFFILQMLCIKAKNFYIKIIPIYLIVFLLMLAILKAVLDGINPYIWFDTPFYLLVMVAYCGPKILFFALGDALAWAIYKKKNSKKKTQK